ncbi:MAG: hypothetical protein MUF06_16830 [Pirellulaceae bacterium]|jgi:hypothetical protein|nr:hypothetical protein [Pirellulaceae bacterium]
MIRRFLWILALVLLPAVSFGAPLSRDEFERQQQVLARLREVVDDPRPASPTGSR